MPIQLTNFNFNRNSSQRTSEAQPARGVNNYPLHYGQFARPSRFRSNFGFVAVKTRINVGIVTIQNSLGAARNSIKARIKKSLNFLSFQKLEINCNESDIIRNYIVKQEIFLDIKIIIKRFKQKMLNIQHPTRHLVKYIEGVGCVNLYEFIIKNEDGSVKQDKNGYVCLNAIGERFLHQAALLYAGYVIEQLLETKITSIKKKPFIPPKYLKFKIKNFISECIELRFDTQIEIAGHAITKIDYRIIFDLFCVTLSDNTIRKYINLPTAFVCYNRSKYLNPLWDVNNSLKMDEIILRWEETKQVFRSTYLVDKLKSLYKDMGLSELETIDRIKYELDITDLEYNNVFSSCI